MSASTDRHGVEILTNSACDELLQRTAVGRVGFMVDGEVDILPVSYVMEGRAPAFRTAEGEKLDAALRGAPVSFQIDGWDDAYRSGWSVLVKGTADAVTDADTLDRLDAVGLVPWAAGDRDRWVRIQPHEITGRRLG